MKMVRNEIRRRFQRHGIRLTAQRAAIYLALAETTLHPTAEDLYQRVRREYPALSRNTVYYTLAALQRAGLVHEVNYGHERARFDANTSVHHHLVCLGCRRITDVMDAEVDSLIAGRRRRDGFEVISHRVEFQGYCPACCRARRRAPGVARARRTAVHRRAS